MFSPLDWEQDKDVIFHIIPEVLTYEIRQGKKNTDWKGKDKTISIQNMSIYKIPNILQRKLQGLVSLEKIKVCKVNLKN